MRDATGISLSSASPFCRVAILNRALEQPKNTKKPNESAGCAGFSFRYFTVRPPHVKFFTKSHWLWRHAKTDEYHHDRSFPSASLSTRDGAFASLRG
jgi:hypothetical protein